MKACPDAASSYNLTVTRTSLRERIQLSDVVSRNFSCMALLIAGVSLTDPQCNTATQWRSHAGARALATGGRAPPVQR